jgi:hypothetical protein
VRSGVVRAVGRHERVREDRRRQRQHRDHQRREPPHSKGATDVGCLAVRAAELVDQTGDGVDP